MQRNVHQVEFSAMAFATSLEVADWAVAVLAGAGLSVGVPSNDDGMAEVAVHGPGRVVVGCVAFTDEGDDGACTCTVEDVPRRLRRTDPEAAALAARTVAALDAALRADPAVAGVRWTQGGPAS